MKTENKDFVSLLIEWYKREKQKEKEKENPNRKVRASSGDSNDIRYSRS
jgi:hypothetical protein